MLHITCGPESGLLDSAAILLWGVLFSSVGLGYLIYGRRQKHKIAFYSGVGLLVYPYFVGNVTQMIIAGVILMSLPRFLKL
jgi:hypothetical protein